MELSMHLSASLVVWMPPPQIASWVLQGQVVRLGKAPLLPRGPGFLPLLPPHPDPFSPRMELPPLSPGIQVRVMEEAEVLETVRRG